MDNDLKRLTEMVRDIKILESQLSHARDRRNRLALKIVDSGHYSLRKVAEYAGVQNPYLVELRKKLND